MNKCDVCVHMYLDRGVFKCDISDFESTRRTACDHAVERLGEIINPEYIPAEFRVEPKSSKLLEGF